MMRFMMTLALAMTLGACQREDRDYRPDPAVGDVEPQITMSSNTPGPSVPTAEASEQGIRYEANAYQISQGKQFYTWFNCNGCHANGGGGSGPPLMDDSWIYGSSIDNIVRTILEGRPNGMPSFRGKLTDDQVWQIAAFVRSMSGNVPSDAAPGRNDDLSPHPPEGQLPKQDPVPGGMPSPAEQMPQ
jgi:cytochrome c oxidase cbb3-type subunit III